MDKLTLSVQELAECLGISMPKAYQLTHQPDFPVLQVGNRRLIPVKEFQDWLKMKSTGGDPHAEN